LKSKTGPLALGNPEIDCKQRAGCFRKNGDVFVHSLPQKKRGRPLFLGYELNNHVKKYLKEARKVGTPIDTTVVMASEKL